MTIWRFLLLLLLGKVSLGEQRMQVEYASHPLFKEIEAALTAFSNKIPNRAVNPNGPWMKQFLNNFVRTSLDKLPVTVDSLVSNIKRIMEYHHKGWLKSVSRGEKNVDDLWFPDESNRPVIIPCFIPMVTSDSPKPSLQLAQLYNKKEINKLNINSESQQTNVDRTQRQRRSNKKNYWEKINFLKDKEATDTEKDRADDSGKTDQRIKRDTSDTPVNFTVVLDEDSAFIPSVISVKIDPNTKRIVYPSD